MTHYRIRDWNTHYEINRTRELKRMEWVPVPNRMDSAGYTALVDHPDAAAHFGAWIAIVEIASRQKVRGTFPHPAAEIPQALARISRLPAGLFAEVIPRLLSIGWIESFQLDTEIPHLPAEKSHDGAGIPHLPAVSRAREQGTEGKGREGNNTEGNALIESYRELLDRWQAPNESGKVFNCADVDLGCQVWIGLVDSGKLTEGTLPDVFAGLERWRRSAQWKKGMVHSVPTWLGWSKNGTPAAPRWNDKPEQAPESEY